jgi:DNA replication protein DnaC
MMNTYDLNTLFDKLRRLRLKAFLAALETLRDQEPERLAPFASQLENMVDQELAERTERTIARRIQEARFVRIQTVDAFDFGYNASTKALRRTFLRLLQADHVAQGRALGYAACQRGQRVLFLPCTTMLNRLVAADATKDLERAIKNLLSPALLLIDELAYITMSPAEANLFFQVISRRHDHHRPTVVTTNKPFQEWNQVFHSDATAHAIVDRLTERAEIFYLEGKSYRQTHRTKLRS